MNHKDRTAEISVTSKDCRKGDFTQVSECPAALAIRRACKAMGAFVQLDGTVKIYNKESIVDQDGLEHCRMRSTQLPVEAHRWLVNCQRAGEFTPVRFKLEFIEIDTRRRFLRLNEREVVRFDPPVGEMMIEPFDPGSLHHRGLPF